MIKGFYKKWSLLNFLPWEIPSKRIRETIIAENPMNIYNKDIT